MILSGWILLIMRNISDKPCTENQNTFYVQNFSQNRAVYVIVWNNSLQPDRSQIAM